MSDHKINAHKNETIFYDKYLARNKEN